MWSKMLHIGKGDHDRYYGAFLSPGAYLSTKGARKQLIAASMLALFASTVVAPVSAQDEDKGWFIGGSLGRSDDDILNQEASAAKLFGGYQFMKHFGVEFAAVGLGEFDFLGVPDALDQGGIAVQAVGIVPIGESFALFVKAGFFSWSVEAFGLTDDGTDGAYGVGGQVHFGKKKNWGARLEWERFTDVFGGDIDLVSAGVRYHFR